MLCSYMIFKCLCVESSTFMLRRHQRLKTLQSLLRKEITIICSSLVIISCHRSIIIQQKSHMSDINGEKAAKAIKEIKQIQNKRQLFSFSSSQKDKFYKRHGTINHFGTTLPSILFL